MDEEAAPRPRRLIPGLPDRWQPGRIGLISLAVWLATSAIFLLLSWQIFGPFAPFLAQVILILALVVGAGIMAASLIAGIRHRGALVVAAGFALGGAILFASQSSLGMASENLKFLLERPDYERITQRVRAENLGTDAEIRLSNRPVWVDREGPLRIGFVWFGIADNWTGVVYDPTDVVATAKGWGKAPGDYTASPEAKALFGGDLVYCRVLSRPYYLCSFT